MLFTIIDNRVIDINVDDFVDVLDGTIPNDYLWGRSYEVIDIDICDTQIMIRINLDDVNYIETMLDCILVVDNWKLVPDEV